MGAYPVGLRVFGDRPSTLRDPFTCDIVFLDVETSGLAPEYHDIIEIGAIRASQPDWRVLQEYEAKIKMVHPERAQSEALHVNGYSEDAWVNAVPLRQAMIEIWGMVQRSAICAHKAGFDEYFLYHALKRCSFIIHDGSAPWFYVLDTLSNSQLLLRGIAPRLRGKIVAESLGLPPEPEPHRAIHGARQCFEIYKRQRQMIDNPDIADRLRALAATFIAAQETS